jgi:hypothetical protein
MTAGEGFSLQPSAGPADIPTTPQVILHVEPSAPQLLLHSEPSPPLPGIAPAPRTEGRPAVVWSSAAIPSAPADLRADRDE